ncbi:hypothetical protein MX652_09165 [Thauera aromatica]|nr:hypothetical protein [Thauera aromatica]MCK2126857.1 hypothetical protein [Thauera aromatica]
MKVWVPAADPFGVLLLWADSRTSASRVPVPLCRQWLNKKAYKSIRKILFPIAPAWLG